ncbi:MAG: hypothetical protein Ct9H300mP27_02090 [Chloroflexota bacterium]|nr:MAG: hypothetical protein Ct9H300mP27_02090 [Chloroflexota bacterium]
MNIGVSAMASDKHGDIGTVAKKVEEVGFESIWLPEHPGIPVNHNSKYGGPQMGLSHRTCTLCLILYSVSPSLSHYHNLELGTGISLVPEHNPIDLAKEIPTLDHILW